ncbi:MAG TPA: FtsX-like permease family protein [Candidatus Krumholzibacteria bacterium]|nr:FtsX-like permease family protein [Candidatus Krumholzibacteria bacterium]
MKLPFKYNAKSLFVRRGNTLMTVGSIALVVLVYIGVLGMAAGLSNSLRQSGDALNVIVLREGARSETESAFDRERQRLVESLPGAATGSDGAPLVSSELVTLQIFPRADGKESNVALRGMGVQGPALRAGFRLVQGTMFHPGVGEVIVGDRLAQRFPGLAMGEEVNFGRLRFRVVGTFRTGGSFDSEVWGAMEDFGNAFRREDVSAVLLRAATPEGADALIARVQGEQRLRLQAKRETEYYADQTTATATQFIALGTALAVLMALGACFAAANTMYAHVAARAQEIGTLRALGFRRRNILGAFLTEAALLGLVAGAAGVLLALPLNGLTTGTTNFVTFSELSFTLRTTPSVLAIGVLLALATAVLGGFPPALAAARRPITALLRESG